MKASPPDLPETKRKLLDTSIKLMRIKGFNATSVDDICKATGITKGGFFHYFKSKEDIAKAALLRHHEIKTQASRNAPFRQLDDPLERVYGRLDFVKESFGGTTTKGCLIGMFAQELSLTHPELRKACQESFLQMTQDFEHDLAEAKSKHAPDAEFDPKKLALFFISIIQGSSLMAKAAESNTTAIDNIEEFRKHVRSLFGQPPVRRPHTKQQQPSRSSDHPQLSFGNI